MNVICMLSMLQLHTTDLDDGYEWGRLNLQSVTERSALNDFLATAELAGTEFTAGVYTISSLSPSYRFTSVSVCSICMPMLPEFVSHKFNRSMLFYQHVMWHHTHSSMPCS